MSTVKWYGKKATSAARDGAVKGLEESTARLLKLSQSEVPVSRYARGGYLKDSASSAVDKSELVGSVTYNTPAEPSLPVWVHERTDVRHDTGGAKFLEGPLNANKDALLGMVADAIKAKLK